MFIKKLPHHEQSLLISTSCINTYKKAVEELVYNSIDAEATSIAIRINIDQSSIQVIDNGSGITKTDMHVLGQRYMTSKNTENINVKSIQNTYGKRGESLANLVEVSKTVNITSRYDSSDETWEKRFRKGKIVNIEQVSQRPSKGTTVEIKGFLYNRNIQTKNINQLNELQAIKIYLEQFSLVHTHISLSLRDDSKNEIIFQVHKKRDIYQTLTSLYSIDKSEIQELKVQKNEYSVTAYIAKESNKNNKDLIFLNRENVVGTSKLHKIVNDNLNKYLKNQYHRKKSKIKFDDEEIYLYKNRLPFYFLFIQCPIKDYDVIDKLIEFSDWNQVTKLLEKLVKFYANDIKLKPVADIGELENGEGSEDTRHQVKKIMNKILASNSKALGVSQMRNGIKGKITKRKNKTKQMNSSKNHSQIKLRSKFIKHSIKEVDGKIDSNRNNKIQSNIVCNNELDTVNTNICNNKLLKTKYANNTNDQTTEKPKRNQISKDVRLHENRKKSGVRMRTKSKTDRRMNSFNNNPIIRRFINPTNSVKKRCEVLAEKAHNILNSLNNYEFHRVDEINQCSTPNKYNKVMYYNEETKCNKKYDKYDISKKTYPYNNEGKYIKTTKDLLKPVINFQDNKTDININENSVINNNNEGKYKFKPDFTSKIIQNSPVMSKLTYESHNYEMITCNRWKLNKLKFISRKSIDNFTVPDIINRPKMWQKTIKRTHSRQLNEEKQIVYKKQSDFNKNNSLMCTSMLNIEEYSQNIYDVLKSNTIYNENNTFEEINAILSNFTFSYNKGDNLSLFIKNTSDNMLSNTYILQKDYDDHKNQSLLYPQEDIRNDIVFPHQCNSEDINVNRNKSEFLTYSNIIGSTEITPEKDVSNTLIEKHVSDTANSNKPDIIHEDYAPINVCEAVYLSSDLFEKELEYSFNNNSKQNDVLNVGTNEILCDKENNYEMYTSQNNNVNCSHHFNNNNTSNLMKSASIKEDNAMACSVVAIISNDKQIIDLVEDIGDNDQSKVIDLNEKCEIIDHTTFNLINRLRFVPKGLSPIFKNCYTKQVLDYNLDYYHENLYQNFVNAVQINSEIYEAQIQKIKSHSKHVNNWMSNVETNDISLDFNGKSLEDALILNQVDNKFIAAIIRNNGKPNVKSSNFLVLFDQHAVHERIRLENNMSEYFTNGQWKSVAIDSMTILLPKEDILYLHNYKDKFSQLGLQWIMGSSNEIVITAVPEAILGQNPRQVDNIMNAIRHMLTEQINNIKSQKGCISVYPKSIMDLVFSEACRYAVMFGDKLTKDYCGELIKLLSKCKKPFQCAHGRPVMAVIMDLENNKREYKADLSKLKHFGNMKNH